MSDNNETPEKNETPLYRKTLADRFEDNSAWTVSDDELREQYQGGYTCQDTSDDAPEPDTPDDAPEPDTRPWIITEKGRRWLYAVAAAILAVVAVYFGIEAAEQESIMTLIGAILNIGGASALTYANRKVS